MFWQVDDRDFLSESEKVCVYKYVEGREREFFYIQVGLSVRARIVSFVRIIKLDVSNVPRNSSLLHCTLKCHPMSRVVQGVYTARCALCPRVKVHFRTLCLLCSSPIFFSLFAP